jgi:hypothetical protein
LLLRFDAGHLFYICSLCLIFDLIRVRQNCRRQSRYIHLSICLSIWLVSHGMVSGQKFVQEVPSQTKGNTLTSRRYTARMSSFQRLNLDPQTSGRVHPETVDKEEPIGLYNHAASVKRNRFDVHFAVHLVVLGSQLTAVFPLSFAFEMNGVRSGRNRREQTDVECGPSYGKNQSRK